MSFLDKLRKLPEKKKTTIVWIIVISLGIIMYLGWTMFSFAKAKNFQTEKIWESLRIDDLKKDIKEDLPSLDFPQDLKNINVPEGPQDFNQ